MLKRVSYILRINYEAEQASLPYFSRVGLGLLLPVSSKLAWRSSLTVIYVGGPLKGPRSTTTGDTHTHTHAHAHTQYSVLSLISLVNCNVFYKTEVW